MKKRLMTFLGIVTAMVVAVGGAAVASEAVEEVVSDNDPTLTRPPIEAEWDEDFDAVLISIGEDDPCEGVVLERDEDGVLVVIPPDGEDPESIDSEASPECLVYDGIGKDGKVNKGTMQSSVASQLSPHDLDVPKGWIMRAVAKNKPMKVKAKDVEQAPPTEATTEDGADDRPNKGKAKGHEKKKAKKNKGARGG